MLSVQLLWIIFFCRHRVRNKPNVSAPSTLLNTTKIITLGVFTLGATFSQLTLATGLQLDPELWFSAATRHNYGVAEELQEDLLRSYKPATRNSTKLQLRSVHPRHIFRSFCIVDRYHVQTRRITARHCPVWTPLLVFATFHNWPATRARNRSATWSSCGPVAGKLRPSVNTPIVFMCVSAISWPKTFEMFWTWCWSGYKWGYFAWYELIPIRNRSEIQSVISSLFSFPTSSCHCTHLHSIQNKHSCVVKKKTCWRPQIISLTCSAFETSSYQAKCSHL